VLDSDAWKGSVWFQVFKDGSQPEINIGTNGLQRLDYVVKSAEKRGIKLIVPFVNNWEDYGGMAAYRTFCQQDIDSKSEWYKSTKCQDQYRKYIRTVVSRYTNSTAIFAWELANEPRCGGCETEIITEWAKKTSKYIKSLAPNHMVAVGDEGFGLIAPPSNPEADSYPNGFNEGTDFAALIAIPDIDLGTFHLYPDHCKFKSNITIVSLT
jgi:mannan endo-1,4-beta-mannosidase